MAADNSFKSFSRSLMRRRRPLQSSQDSCLLVFLRQISSPSSSSLWGQLEQKVDSSQRWSNISNWTTASCESPHTQWRKFHNRNRKRLVCSPWRLFFRFIPKTHGVMAEFSMVLCCTETSFESCSGCKSCSTLPSAGQYFLWRLTLLAQTFIK